MSLKDQLRTLKTKFHAAEEYSRNAVAARQIETIVSIIVIAAMIVVGIIVVDEISSASTFGNGNVGDGGGVFDNATDNATDTSAEAFEFAPVILIVLVAGLVIGVVRGFAGR